MQTRWQRYPRKLITSARPSRQEARGRGASKSQARIRGDTTVEVLDYSDTHVPRERGVKVGALDLQYVYGTVSRCVDGGVLGAPAGAAAR